MTKIKPKRKNNSTAKILLLAVVVIFLISIAVFTKNVMKPKKVYKDIAWEELSGKVIPTNYEIIKTDSYDEYSYNLDTNEIKNSFTVLFPSDIKLESINTNAVKYNNDNTNIVVTKTMFNSKKEELERLNTEYTSLYDKIQIKNSTYDENIFAVMLEYGKYNEDLSMLSFNQEIRIYIKANSLSEYALIIINTNEKRLDVETISKIINSITINKKQNKFCSNSKCEANLKTLHNALLEKVTIKINKNKYVLQNNLGLSMYNADFVTKSYENEQDEKKAPKKHTKITVNILYGDENLELIKNMKEMEINNKNVYYSTNVRRLEEDIYEGRYIYEISDKLFLKIEVNSSLNNIDEVIKDFMEFKFK